MLRAQRGLLGQEPARPLPRQAPLTAPTAEARRSRPLLLAAALLGAAVLVLGGCAGVAEVTGTATQDDIQQLRNDLSALQRSVQRARSDSEAVTALERRLREQATASEQQTASLTRRLDGLTTTLGELTAKLDDLNGRVESLNRQLRATVARPAAPIPGPAAGSGVAVAPGPAGTAVPAPGVSGALATPAMPPATPAPSQPPAGAATPAPSTPATPATARPTTGALQPNDIYQVAYIDYSKGSYPLAIAGFREFLRRYPDHDLADNAQYWIGEAQVGMARNFANAGQPDKAQQSLEQAVVEFRKVLANYPRGDKAPTALYKEALALIELKQPEQAQARLQYLVDNFPQAEEASLARERLFALRGR